MAQNAYLQEQNLGVASRGAKASYMKLISADGFSYFIEKSVALASDPITFMYIDKLEAKKPFANVLCLNGIKGRAMDTVCKYLLYRAHYEDIIHKYDMTKEIPKFPIEPEDSLDCFLAACYFSI